MSLSDFAADAFSAVAAIGGVPLAHYKGQTLTTPAVTAILENGPDLSLPYDGSPGPDYSARIFALASAFTAAPAVGDTLTSSLKRYRVTAVRREEGDPVLVLECKDTPL